MNTELKITKGIWRNPEGTTFITCGSKQMIDYAGYKTTEDEDDANAQLIIDAGNTIQSCGLLPSELLKQRNKMRELLIKVSDKIGFYSEFPEMYVEIQKYIKSIEK